MTSNEMRLIFGEFWESRQTMCDTNHRVFDTGAKRGTEAEGTRYDLISPIGLEAVARTCAGGAGKYGDYNWEKGMPVHDLLNHAIRHLYLYLGGDRSEPHLPHAAWNVLAAIHSDVLWPQLNWGHLREPGCLPPRSVSPESNGRPRLRDIVRGEEVQG